ncbi:efflux RND transporter periplasmic adaptor subunit [Permianibacter sp. IMCC34836]|uniref:efflux RND transporter periplasmic adaptor subunit n=1 Tax=Permianibacter fluminis TaxID=2738515 RepID=UPI001557017D|nr:efflux RND transporter periplasmic adaptor subunit [Permianibacter fluminis]NQD35813.1 efflux RND transporter periplasmic adaptor subunit [Permianibacter fluminis]
MIRDTSGQDVVLTSAPTRRKKLVLAGSLVGITVLSTLAWPAYERWSSASISVPAARLRFGDVSVGVFERDAAVQGKIVAANSPTLYSSTTGTVTLQVQAGDSVTIGSLLAIIDSPELRNELAREQATYESMTSELGRARIEAKQKLFEAKRQIDLAQVALTAADREKRRADDPRLSQALSKLEYEKVADELDKARITYDNAVAHYKLLEESTEFDVKTKQSQQTRQRLVADNLKRQVEALQLKSPVNGMVGTIHIAQKAVVPINTKLITVVDLTAYAAELDVPESYADDIGIGMAAEIQINGQNYLGNVSAISPEVQNNLVKTRVQWQGETPPNLRQNQRLSARVLFERREQVVTVPRGPFFESGGGRIVYVVQDGVAHKRTIRTGASSVGAVEVLEGLQVGERIIVSSTSDFKDAESVLLND